MWKHLEHHQTTYTHTGRVRYTRTRATVLRFFLARSRDVAQTAICATTALLTPADSLKAAHSPVRIVLSTQQPSLEPCQSASVIAYTARCPTAFKPACQPVHGESSKSPLRSANASNAGALGHSMEHMDDIHHASALKPHQRAATHLQPP